MTRSSPVFLLSVAGLLLLATCSAFADGNETLGIPSIPIANGSGFVAKGIGLTLGQPGTINLNVPAGVTIKQVLVYWEGQHYLPSGDANITVGGNAVTGTLVGGPDFFFPFNGNVYSSTYRADITSLGLITPGANAVQISGMAYGVANNGAGLFAIYDDGTNADIQLVDGNDLAYRFFPAPRSATVPQTFTFDPAPVVRTAKMSLFFSSVQGTVSGGGPQRPNRVSVTVGAVTTNYDNVLSSGDGEEWDTYTVNVTIPAGETQVTVQAISGPGGDDDPNTPDPKPASLAWIGAGFSVPCVGRIGDFVWYDTNQDGIQDAGEAGIPNVTLKLYDGSNTLLGTTITDANGGYLFTGLRAGSYVVEVDATTLPAGLTASPCANTAGIGNNSNCSPSPVTLPTDASEDLTIDFGYYTACVGKIGDFVWYDTDQDGIQDAGEVGIPNVTVKLLDASNVLLATDVTDANGAYLFENLCAGSYNVEVDASTLPAGMTASPCANTAGVADNSNCSPSPVVLATNTSQDLTIDFGYYTPCTGTIGDFVWKDLDRDGIQDAGEPGISGVTVRLFDGADNLLATAVTGAGGEYLFTGLCAGSYEVEVDATTLPGGLVPSPCSNTAGVANNSNCSPSPVVLATNSSQDLTIDFGYNAPVCNGKIGNFIWKDSDCDGLQEAGEPGIRGVKVRLLDAAGNLLMTATTDCWGYYLFCGLCPGTYTVEVVGSTLPTNYTPTVCSNAAGVANNSNCSPATVVIGAGVTEDRTIDFGYCVTVCRGKIGNFVWKDLDCDGIQDACEPGIRNVTVRLLNSAGTVIATTVTDCYGYYLFCNLCAGEYTVQVVTSTLPANMTPTTCSNAAGIANNSNCSPAPVVLATGTTEDKTIDFGFCEQRGGEGCTPGYWKQCQHFDSWPWPYRPTTLFSAVFDNAFPGKTLLQVLCLNGGGLEALGRHTVAALLSAASSHVDYDMTAAQVISAFNAAYPGSSSSYETLKNIFAGYNEQGCPLNKGLADADGEPTETRLFQNYPNPFNPSTEITFQLPEAALVKIRVFDILGREVKLLGEGQFEAGAHVISWDATDSHGIPVTTGVYFCHLQSGSTSQIIKMSLMR